MNYAGTNEIIKYGHKAREAVMSFMEPNEAGFYNLPLETRAWNIGSSNGKYGEFCKMLDTCFPVNSRGYAYAKAGTEKGDKMVECLKAMLAKMEEMDDERCARQFGKED